MIWIVFVVLGAIRDFVKTNYTKNYKGIFQPLSANSALQAKVCMHSRVICKGGVIQVQWTLWLSALLSYVPS